MPVAPLSLSEVRPVKQEDEGDIGDEGRRSRRDGCRPLQPMKLGTLIVGMWNKALMWSDEVKHGFVVAAATGQNEAATAREMR